MMLRQMPRHVLILLLLLSARYAWAAPGAAVPWTTYEAETMTGIRSISGPSYTANTLAGESSGRTCARLTATSNYIQFTSQAPANAIVVRYSVPDTSDGAGTDYTLSLYKNGDLLARLPMTSKYSWLYGAYPFTNYPPASSPRNFYDEVRTNGLSIAAGDVLKLQKDTSDTAASYAIDLVDLENVSSPLPQPANSLSITNFGGRGNGTSDDTAALISCINNAVSQGKIAWLPPGTYKITSSVTFPANLTLQGAGMWHTTLVGDAAVYQSPASRLSLVGNGSNIRISDFAIVGRLNYRSDTEPNDSLGGSFGQNSTISRIWVEHTKTGAWLVNSSNLVVDGCRFRNTLADGINLCVGMRGCILTNCTTRGTGDDCFAVWPATYLGTPTYTPGLNVIRNCSAETPFLANGAAIYGGEGNRVEDCSFRDMTYGCGILFSSTFPVTHTFSGITTAQRCDLNRCGGDSGPGFGWRGAVQLCLDNKSMSGVNLSNLNITNSASDGLSIIAPGSSTGTGTGTLSNAVMSNVTIPNYGVGTSSRHGLWAKSDAIGSMTVSNCTIVEYRDDSANFTFNFVTSNIPVTVQTSPAGRSFSVDGTNFTTAQTFGWLFGSSHTIATTSPQSGGAGTQHVWSAWSDGGAISHSVTASVATTNTATFSRQFQLNMNATPGGSLAPSSLWTNSGTTLPITAAASNGFAFSGWVGSGNGAYSGTNNPASVTMNGPISETASFTQLPTNPPAQLISGIRLVDGAVKIVSASTAGYSYRLESATNLAPARWTEVPGSLTNASGNMVSFTDTNPQAGPSVYYRTASP